MSQKELKNLMELKETEGALKGFVMGIMFAIVIAFIVIIGPSLCNLMILRDTRNFIEQNYKPTDMQARNDAYNALVDYNNSLINSENPIISFFFSKSITVKFIIIFFLAIPCINTFFLFKQYFELKRIAKAYKAHRLQDSIEVAK